LGLGGNWSEAIGQRRFMLSVDIDHFSSCFFQFEEKDLKDETSMLDVSELLSEANTLTNPNNSRSKRRKRSKTDEL
jgi:hypothetical protein